jgi:hypothetical protein
MKVCLISSSQTGYKANTSLTFEVETAKYVAEVKITNL